jgi:hypothetical protein
VNVFVLRVGIFEECEESRASEIYDRREHSLLEPLRQIVRPNVIGLAAMMGIVRSTVLAIRARGDDQISAGMCGCVLDCSQQDEASGSDNGKLDSEFRPDNHGQLIPLRIAIAGSELVGWVLGIEGIDFGFPLGVADLVRMAFEASTHVAKISKHAADPHQHTPAPASASRIAGEIDSIVIDHI